MNTDVGEDDCGYRFLHAGKVVYVCIRPSDIIEKEDQTFAWAILRLLSTFPAWERTDWSTMTILRTPDGKLDCRLDDFEPHRISSAMLRSDLPVLSLFDLEILNMLSSAKRVSLVQHGETEFYFKMAPFQWLLHSLEHELSIYHYLEEHEFKWMPHLRGYAFENEPSRVVGFLIDEIPGRAANIEDLEACTAVIRRLHDVGVVHGDIRRYNFVVMPSGEAKAIDFETSILRTTKDSEEWGKLKQDELEQIEDRLRDESGIGKPMSGMWY